MARYTIQARQVTLLLGAAAMFGLSPEALLSDVRLSADDLRDPEARVPYEVAMALWDEIPRRAGREHFGVELSARVPFGHNDVVDYVARHSDTLGQAFGQVIRFQRILFDGGSLSLAIDGREARLRQALRDGSAVPRHLAEFVLALFLRRGRSFVEAELWPLEVRFRHEAPPDPGPLRELFGARLRFAQPATELVFDAAAMELRMRAPDPALRGVLERHASMLLEKARDPDDFVARVRADVGQHIKAGPPIARDVARRTGVSERTLHRRLADVGQHYQGLVDGVRKELALAHMRDYGAPFAEIAFLLGFSEASSFHRAFRRWTGTTPGAYRRDLVA